ncbi:hypothetical protein PHYBOEH_006722 [Phytophthora boehmeriae]|uniref:Uncharacterized protein n=1 Tax=Phytophthora boehmeriae TaxID=109152 RepID=A0A8T1X816_9STRA|nr:hypothetical protein PHYBOEH_006722 [Phytophthora boehmeriae]
MDRVLSSPGRQKALVRLMSSDPSLLSGLEDELLASITLLSAPPADRRRRSSRERSARATETQERKNIQLYSEGEAFAMKEEDKMEDATRATTVLLSPCSKAAAVAATASTKQDVRCAASAAAPTTRCTLKTSASGISPIVLLDETTLSQVGGRSTACLTVSGRSGSVQKKSKKNKRRGRKKNSTSSSGSSCSGDDRFQRRLPESSKMRRGVASSMVLKGKQGFASDSDEGPPILNSRVTMSTIVRAVLESLVMSVCEISAYFASGIHAECAAK